MVSLQHLSNRLRMSTMNRCPAMVVAGRPSAGGRRTVVPRQGCHATFVTTAPTGAGPHRLCTVQAAHAMAATGCPSFGGQRACCAPHGRNRSACSQRRSVWQHLKRSSSAVHILQVVPLGSHAAEYGLPNPALQRTVAGKPAPAAEGER